MSSNETFDTGIVDISEFFSGGDSSFNEEESENKSTFNEVDSPIKELKAIILSLDWEITDDIADSFITEIDRLSDVWQSDKSVVSFLSILRALGKYLRTHKADAHPDSIKILYSVYNNFEKIVLTNEITEEQEKGILKEELEKFHKLKEKIALAAVAESEGKANESLLSALKTILLEIDWQITDQTMQKFDIEISKLEQIWITDKNFLTLLQMMRAIGTYINKNKLDSHPDSIKLLSTVFQHFEQMALSEDINPEEQHKLIQGDLEKFTQLKKQIIAVKPASPAETFVDTEDKEAPASQVEASLPAFIHEEEGSPDNEDFGYVEPISFDSDETAQPPAADISDMSHLQDGSEAEVQNRLNDLFADNNDFDVVEPIPQEHPLDSGEVDGRLDDLFAEDDQGVALDSFESPSSFDTNEIVPLSDTEAEDFTFSQEGVTPLPALDDTDDTIVLDEEVVPLADESFADSDFHSDDSPAPLPPGQISSDIYPDQGMESVTPLGVEPLPVEPLPVEPVPQDEVSSITEDSPTLDFGVAAEPGISLNEISPEQQKEEDDFQPNLTANLLEVVRSAENLEQLNIAALTDEIKCVQDSLQSPAQKISLQIIQSITLYIEKAGSIAHPDCLKVLLNSCEKLAKSGIGDLDQGGNILNNIQETLNQYIEFQNCIIYPAVTEFAAKEKEIKKILGLAS